MKSILSIFFILSILWTVNSQEENILFDADKNKIENNDVLQDFNLKLQTNQPVNILHIGDSHIQANFFSGKLRELFQSRYGESSRGIVFPLRLTKTNGHVDIRFFSDIQWVSNKIVDRKNKDVVGVSGVSISTTKPNFYIKLKNTERLNISRIKIIGIGLEKLQFGLTDKRLKSKKITSKGKYSSKTYKVKKGDFLGKIARKFKVSIRNLKRWNNLGSDRIGINQKLRINIGSRKNRVTYAPSKINLKDFELIKPVMISDTEIIVDIDNPFKELYIISDDENKKSFTKIDGVFLENFNAGVTYNSIGVNSAKFSDYNKSELFFEQLATNITPDLVIVSLGTNESFNNVYTAESLRKDAQKFIEKIKQNTNCYSILITTPPSSLVKRKYTNKKLGTFTNTLKELAKEKGYAVWDLYDIMGRKKGVQNWYSKGLAAKDKIHYAKEGYFLQADLLFDALTNHL